MYTIKELAAPCAAFRKQAGYSQNDVAKITGYNQRTISAFERGMNNNAELLYYYYFVLRRERKSNGE